MESHQPQKNQELEGLPDGQPPPPRRFRIVKLEERIAPKKGGDGNTKKCYPLLSYVCESNYCW
jgi:hypothetical protein